MQKFMENDDNLERRKRIKLSEWKKKAEKISNVIIWECEKHKN